MNRNLIVRLSACVFSGVMILLLTRYIFIEQQDNKVEWTSPQHDFVWLGFATSVSLFSVLLGEGWLVFFPDNKKQ